ncbi:MAG: cobalamin biosynthesis protein [Methylocella sp.]
MTDIGAATIVRHAMPGTNMQRDKGAKRQDVFSECHPAVAIGIGCKRGCRDAIAALVGHAIAAPSYAGAPGALFTHEAKKGDAGLASAAKALGLPLVFLEAGVLRQASLRAVTNSPRVMAMFGLPSIAEAAALAGAGPSSVLLVARMSEGGASCAIAGKSKRER